MFALVFLSWLQFVQCLFVYFVSFYLSVLCACMISFYYNVCDCHAFIKGNLLTYLLTYSCKAAWENCSICSLRRNGQARASGYPFLDSFLRGARSRVMYLAFARVMTGLLYTDWTWTTKLRDGDTALTGPRRATPLITSRRHRRLPTTHTYVLAFGRLFSRRRLRPPYFYRYRFRSGRPAWIRVSGLWDECSSNVGQQSTVTRRVRCSHREA